jgi:hypothetical protein
MPPKRSSEHSAVSKSSPADGDGTVVRKFLNALLPEANLGVRRTTRDESQPNQNLEETRAAQPYA